MAINIRSISVGGIYIQSGNGIPTHLSPKGTIFVDVDSANEFISNGNGSWKSSYLLTQNQYDAITGATSASSTNVFATINDIISHSGATPNLSQVLFQGNTTGANDIIIQTGQTIKSDTSGNFIAIDDGGINKIKVFAEDDVTIISDNQNVNIIGGFINLNPAGYGGVNISGNTNVAAIDNNTGSASYATINSNGTLNLSGTDGSGNTVSLDMQTNSNGVQLSTDDSNRFSTVAVNNLGLQLYFDDSTANKATKLDIRENINVSNNGTNNSFVIDDGINSKGAVYRNDYSHNFTDESLITKRFMNNAISAATSGTSITIPLNQVAIGNATGLTSYSAFTFNGSIINLGQPLSMLFRTNIQQLSDSDFEGIKIYSNNNTQYANLGWGGFENSYYLLLKSGGGQDIRLSPSSGYVNINNGTIQINSFASTGGTRMVVTDLSGILSTQTIPNSSIWINSSGSLSAIMSGSTNIASGTNALSVGSGNRATGTNNVVFGTNSSAGPGSTNFVVGSNHLVTGTTLTSLNSSVIGGANITISGSARSNAVGTNTGMIISGNQDILLGGQNLTISGVATNSAILGGSNNILTGSRSAIIGGQNINGSLNDTVYVPNLSGSNLTATTVTVKGPLSLGSSTGYPAIQFISGGTPTTKSNGMIWYDPTLDGVTFYNDNSVADTMTWTNGTVKGTTAVINSQFILGTITNHDLVLLTNNAAYSLVLSKTNGYATFNGGITNSNTAQVSINSGALEKTFVVRNTLDDGDVFSVDKTGYTKTITFSAGTYLGLPQNIHVTGGTYSAGTAVFTNNTGGTFSVSGFSSGGSGGTLTINQIAFGSGSNTIISNSGFTYDGNSVSIGNLSGIGSRMVIADSGGTLNTTTAFTKTTTFITETFDFTDENLFVVKTITGSTLTLDNLNSFFYIPIETTETSLDDFSLNGVRFNIENIVDNVSFDIRATAINNATGIYTIKYKISYY